MQASRFTCITDATNQRLPSGSPLWGCFLASEALLLGQGHWKYHKRRLFFKIIILFFKKSLFIAKNSTLFVCKGLLLFPILQTAALLVARCEVHLYPQDLSWFPSLCDLLNGTWEKYTQKPIGEILSPLCMAFPRESSTSPVVRVSFVPAIQPAFDLSPFFSSAGLWMDIQPAIK